MARGKKKEKRPGDVVAWKLRNEESPEVIKWLNSQDNIMDSLRFLVEKEIMENGITNLQLVVPSSRNLNLQDYVNVRQPIISKPVMDKEEHTEHTNNLEQSDRKEEEPQKPQVLEEIKQTPKLQRQNSEQEPDDNDKNNDVDGPDFTEDSWLS